MWEHFNRTIFQHYVLKYNPSKSLPVPEYHLEMQKRSSKFFCGDFRRAIIEISLAQISSQQGQALLVIEWKVTTIYLVDKCEVIWEKWTSINFRVVILLRKIGIGPPQKGTSSSVSVRWWIYKRGAVNPSKCGFFLRMIKKMQSHVCLANCTVSCAAVAKRMNEGNQSLRAE